MRRCFVTVAGSQSKRSAFFLKQQGGKITPEKTDALSWNANPMAVDLMLESNTKFPSLKSKTLDKISAGLTGLKETNPCLLVQASPSEGVTLTSSESDMYFNVNFNENHIHLISPVSGFKQYGYCQIKNKWIDNHDGHDFEGLLTRDLMRHVYGVPNFALYKI